VELTGIVEDIPWLERQSLVVTYRIFFEVVGEATDEELAATLRNLGTRVGPSMLFPFIREQVFSMTGASGRSLLLPLVNWDDVFEEYSMPEPDAEAPEEFLRPVDESTVEGG
jgi:preprotein translocase subunit SecB